MCHRQLEACRYSIDCIGRGPNKTVKLERTQCFALTVTQSFYSFLNLKTHRQCIHLCERRSIYVECRRGWEPDNWDGNIDIGSGLNGSTPSIDAFVWPKGRPPPKKMFSFGHCPNYPLVPLFRTSKTTFCAYDRKIPMMIMTVAMIPHSGNGRKKTFFGGGGLP